MATWVIFREVWEPIIYKDAEGKKVSQRCKHWKPLGRVDADYKSLAQTLAEKCYGRNVMVRSAASVGLDERRFIP